MPYFLKKILFDILRWSETYLRTDMVYLARGGFWLGLGHAVQLGSGLVLAVAFANMLPKEVYGTYQFIMSGAVIVAAFTLTGMSTAITRAVAQGREGALRTGFHTQIVWSAGIVFAGGALASYYYLNGNNTLALSFLIVGTFSPFLAGFGLAKAYFIGKQLFYESTVFGLWRRFIPAVSLLTTLFLTKDPVVLILVYFSSNTLSAGLLYYLLIRRYRLPKHDEQAMIDYSKHLSFLKTFGDIASQADKVLVWVLLGAAPLAAYGLALLPIKHLKELFGLLFPLTFSRLSTQDFATLKNVLPQKVRTFFTATFLAVIVYIALAPFFYKFLFPAYPESILLSQVLALTVLSKPRSLYSQVFIAHKRKREQYFMTLSASSLKIALLLICIPLWGLWGVVWATLAVEAYSNIAVRYLFAKARA